MKHRTVHPQSLYDMWSGDNCSAIESTKLSEFLTLTLNLMSLLALKLTLTLTPYPNPTPRPHPNPCLRPYSGPKCSPYIFNKIKTRAVDSRVFISDKPCRREPCTTYMYDSLSTLVRMQTTTKRVGIYYAIKILFQKS